MAPTVRYKISLYKVGYEVSALTKKSLIHVKPIFSTDNSIVKYFVYFIVISQDLDMFQGLAGIKSFVISGFDSLKSKWAHAIMIYLLSA